MEVRHGYCQLPAGDLADGCVKVVDLGLACLCPPGKKLRSRSCQVAWLQLSHWPLSAAHRSERANKDQRDRTSFTNNAVQVSLFLQ
eukprot:9618-Amphidinium_carterae.2